MSYKLGSLFDGSGGFPLAGSLCGVEPVWAAEVEPYPIAVTRSRFPKMKHLGDISKINGAEIEPVDIITFGSPCQDLSVAGKRAGLKHEAKGDEETTRSGLLMEVVRIIKEMRKATNGQYPRFALWENVPGAFSSNKGEDFRIVCEELIKIVEPTAFMPAVPQNGWNYADSYIGDGWSLAYRVFDAQYWGVPQRRRRIHLVADFRGECARAVLFEREGVRGYFAQGRTPWQGAPANAEGSTGADDREGEGNGADRGRQLADVIPYTLKIRSGCEGGGKGALIQTNKSATLATNNDQYLFQPIHNDLILDDQGGQQIAVRTDGKAPTLRAETHGNLPCVMQTAGFCTEHSAQARGIGYQEECAPTLRAGVTPATVYSIENHPADSRVNIDESGKVQTLTSRMGTGGGNVPLVMETKQDANFIDVEMEVAVRKYEVNVSLLVECLRNHKAGSGFSNKDIAEQLNRPVTEVEHWFRTDSCFAIPSPDIWYKLKALLGIETTEFDQSVTEFEFKGGRYDMRNRIHTGEVAPTLTCGSGNDLHLLPSESKPVICLQGNGIDRADTAGCNGKGWNDETCYTLNTIDRPAVAYGTDVGWLNSCKEQSPTLLARQYKDPHLVTYPKATQYIVRRLTPTECARLQGFADWWGHIEEKKSLTDEEYSFWLEVRNTHAVINGRATKDYTKKAMLTWYNKLWTDSAEYKMWGNGIALPPALYCLQGITDALTAEDDTDDWMD